ncbi:hypothetical protein [Streptomyces sp. NPDC002845]
MTCTDVILGTHRVLSRAAAARQVEDTPLLKVEAVLDQNDPALVTQGNHTHAVLNNNVLVDTDDTVRTSLGVNLSPQQGELTFEQFRSDESQAIDHHRCGATMPTASQPVCPQPALSAGRSSW